MKGDSFFFSRRPNPRHQDTHTPTLRTPVLQRATKLKDDHDPRTLNSRGERPGKKLCELGGPGHTPKTTLRTHSTDNLLHIWPYVLEDTIITMLPGLPSDQYYQSVQTLSHCLWSCCNSSPPPSRKSCHTWVRSQKQQVKLLEYQGPHLASPVVLANLSVVQTLL
jgi:hypothetical protein